MATELARSAGFSTFAIVSTGKTSLSGEPAKKRTYQALTELADGVLETSLSEVSAVCGISHELDPELSNEGEYLCRVASIIADSIDRCSNVDIGDIVNWMGAGGATHLKRLSLPPNFRNAPRRPLAAYFEETSGWLCEHKITDRCLIHSPLSEADGTSLVRLSSSLLDDADDNLSSGHNILSLQSEAYHSTIELMVLSSPTIDSRGAEG